MTHVELDGTRIHYNDEFDIKHYPIRDDHLRLIVSLNIAKEWYYFATAHGVIFEVRSGKKIRFHSEIIQKLMDSQQLRYVEGSSIALTSR